MSKVHQLDVLMSRDFDSPAGVGPWVPLPDVIALGIGPYSRRFQDLRKLYQPQGFDIENRIERCSDGVTRSWYRKVRVSYPQAERPETHFQKPKIHKARKPRDSWQSPIVKTKSWEEVCAERDEKMRQPEPAFELTP